MMYYVRGAGAVSVTSASPHAEAWYHNLWTRSCALPASK
jgi:hypothetical protein